MFLVNWLLVSDWWYLYKKKMDMMKILLHREGEIGAGYFIYEFLLKDLICYKLTGQPLL